MVQKCDLTARVLCEFWREINPALLDLVLKTDGAWKCLLFASVSMSMLFCRFSMLLEMPRSRWLCSSICWDLPVSLLHLKVKTLFPFGKKYWVNAKTWWISHLKEEKVAAQERTRVERHVLLRKERIGNLWWMSIPLAVSKWEILGGRSESLWVWDILQGKYLSKFYSLNHSWKLIDTPCSTRWIKWIIQAREGNTSLSSHENQFLFLFSQLFFIESWQEHSDLY